jgi:signal transduction histidine kinase/CheY-like chemotaxis protein/HPt (histidine-containing phosphotransfer) domain-containing protein
LGIASGLRIALCAAFLLGAFPLLSFAQQPAEMPAGLAVIPSAPPVVPQMAVAPAARSLLLSSKAAIYDPTPAMQLFQEEENAPPVDFTEMLGRFKAAQGERPERSPIILGHNKTPQWIFFNIYNRNPAKTRWILDFGTRKDGIIGVVDRIIIYSDASPQMPLLRDGRLEERKLHIDGQTRNAVPLSFEPGQNRTIGIYIDPSPGSPLALDIKLKEQAVYESQHDRSDLEKNVLLAVVCVIATAYLLFWKAYRGTIPVFLLGYLAINYIIFGTSDEIISQGNNTRVEYFDLICGVGLLIALALSRSVLLSGDDRSPFDRIFLGAKGLVILLIGLSIAAPGTDSVVTPLLIRFLPLAVAALIVFTGTQTFMHQQRTQSAMYTLSWAVFLFGALISEASAIGLVSYSASMINLFWIFFPFHLSFLSFSSLRFLAQAENMSERDREERRRKKEAEDEKNKAREQADQSRLLNVLQREKELMANLRDRENERIQALRRAKEMADQTNKAKSDFLAVISHEIRTPMTGIMGMIRLLLDTPMDEKQKEYARTIQYSGEALLTLLNDILDLSKAEEGKMTLEIVDFDLHKLAESVAMLMSGRAEEKKIALNLQIAPETPALLKGDPTRLRQILLNLIGNAIKFTEEGAVTLSIKVHDNSTKKPRIYFAITDTGIGISEEAQKRIFTPYSQADVSISRNFGGTGLGLAICKRLVEAMGSSIQIHSQTGHGTTFYFILSLDHGVAQEEGADNRQDIRPLRILAIDDNTINQRVVKGLLEKDNHKVVTVGSGEAALNEIRVMPVFDAILMDMEMPIMDGVATTKVIRALEDKEKSRTPIIAMTANTSREDVQRCKDAGMNDYISKPVSPENMRKALLRSVPREANPYVPAEEPAENTTPRPYVPAKRPEPPIPSKPSAAPPTAPAAASSASAQTQKLFNVEILGNLKDSLGKTQMDEMMDGLYQKTEELIGAAEKAIAANDTTALAARGHDIKGMTSNFGLTSLSEISGRLERQAKEKAPMEVLEELVQKLRPTYYDTRSSLDKWLKL